MFIVLCFCLLVRVQALSLAWAGLHDTESLWALFQEPIVEFWLGYPIFYLGTSKFSPQHTSNGLVLSQSHEKCDDSLVRTPYAKSICIFGKSINLNRHALLDTCASYLYILVGHKVILGLYIFIRDNIMRQLLSNGSISRL